MTRGVTFPPLDFGELPAYLPAKDPPPHLYPWEVYNEPRKINPNKSSGPDGVSARLIMEFAYEIIVPFIDILNGSFKEGIVPHQWKKAILVPIPKQTPARIDKLRPVSLTSIFAKIAEGSMISGKSLIKNNLVMFLVSQQVITFSIFFTFSM